MPTELVKIYVIAFNFFNNYARCTQIENSTFATSMKTIAKDELAEPRPTCRKTVHPLFS